MVTQGRLRLVLRARAELDIAEALGHYISESAPAAEGFVNALGRAFAHIRRAPATGSPRWAHELQIPGSRSWPCARFPYLALYMLLPERIEVWRVLHGKRDIPAWLNLISNEPQPVESSAAAAARSG